ncbi:MAG: hypothetical protein J0I06_12630 [Planctomycetes bacterium]|nr:hypothetical protein [Planctomycetota bacterium]
MRHRYIGGAVLAAVVAVGWPSGAVAQDAGFQTPLNSNPVIPIPTGQAGQPGFYTSAEFLMWTQTKSLGNQTIAVRGFFDYTGRITGTPGTLVGSGNDALNTDKMGRREFMPGFRVELGYRFDTGVRLYANYLQFYDAHYSAGATPAIFSPDRTLADTFISAPVYNFNQQFAGAQFNTTADNPTNGGFNTYGIWNAASIMDIKFTQRYQQAEIGMRTPMFATDYSSIYSLGGARFAWIFERFQWRTVDIANDGSAPPQNVANYTNTLSQRMYGLFIGCGHEIYLGSMFSASLDLTAAAYMDVTKNRAKYIVGDESSQSKFGRENFYLVPSGTADFNLWCYPIEGVQLRLGYSAITFFNTRYMREPVGYNFGNIDPNIGTKYFRLLHGFNVGIGFFF